MITEVKYKGIATSPSDYQAQDGEMAIGSNIIADNGALVVPDPSPTPKIAFDSYKPLFIHAPLGGTMANYILQNEQSLYYWTYKQGETSLTPTTLNYTLGNGEGIYQCSAVGNTLIVLTSEGMQYFLWKNGAYSYLGNELPETLLQFSLKTSSITRSAISGDGIFKKTEFADAADAAQFGSFLSFTMAGKQLHQTRYHWTYTNEGTTLSCYTNSQQPDNDDKVYSASGLEIGYVAAETLRFKHSRIIDIPANTASHFVIEYFGHVGTPITSDFTLSGFSSGDSFRLVASANVIVIDLAAAQAPSRSVSVTMSNRGQTTTITLVQSGTSGSKPTYIDTTASYNIAISDNNGGYTINKYTRGSTDVSFIAEEGYSGSLVKLKVKVDSLSLTDKYIYKLNFLSVDNKFIPKRVFISINDSNARNSCNVTDTTTWKQVDCKVSNDPNYSVSFTAEINSSYTETKYGYIIIDSSASGAGGIYTGEEFYESMEISMDKSTESTLVKKAFALKDGKADVDLYNKVMGLANDVLKQYGTGQDHFVYPFFVRYAYRLFDGSLSKPSAPILMVPCSGPTPTIRFNLYVIDRVNHWASIYAPDLYFKSIYNPSALSNFSDIITGIVIAVSPQVPTYNQGYEFDENKTNISLVPLEADDTEGSKNFGYHFITRGNNATRVSQMSTVTPLSDSDNFYLARLPQLTKDEYTTRLLNSSNTYIVHEYDLNTFISTISTNTTKVTLEAGCLDNLVTREVFKENVFSLSRLIPQTAFTYNNRLNIANYDQLLFKGYHAALLNGYYQYPQTPSPLTFAMGSSVSGTANANKYTVARNYSSSVVNGGVMWFFYPDNNANTAVINNAHIPLKQHPLLNGSYWFDGFSELNIGNPSNPASSSQATINITSADRNKYLALSGVQGTTTKIVLTYKKITKLDPSTDIASVNAPTESIVLQYSSNFYISSDGTRQETPDDITNTIIKLTVYGNVTGVSIGNSSHGFTTGAILSNPNKIAASSVNNPFIFEASGVSQIQSQRIIALSSATKALGQEQHGTHPLYVFTDDGIFGMQVDSEGRYITKNPVCRDVVLGGGESVTQIDDAVVFASNRGIMQLYGDTAKCLSDKLKETIYTERNISIPSTITGGSSIGLVQVPFKQFLQGSIIGFDNIEQRLFVFNPQYSYMYVYSGSEADWYIMHSNLKSKLNSYPNNLVVNIDGDSHYNIIDLYDISLNQLTERSVPQSGWFLTRPIDLGHPNELKVIDVVRQNGMFAETSLYAWKWPSSASERPEGWPEVVYSKVPLPNVLTNLYNEYGTIIEGFFCSGLYSSNTSMQVWQYNTPNRNYYWRDVSLDKIGGLVAHSGNISAPSGNDDGSGSYSTKEFAHQFGAYKSNCIQQILYGSNDLKNWFVISSSQSYLISDYSGSPYKWFRLAVRCTFMPGDSLSSVTFSWRKKFDNNKLL